MKEENIYIKSLWIGKELSPIELLSINSYLYNDHIFELYVYESINNVPKGVVIKDASQIIPRSEIFTISLGAFKKSYSIFADYFRYKLLYDQGGWWSDLDAVCLKPYDLIQEYVFVNERLNNEEDKITNEMIKCPVSAPIMKYCYETILNMINNNEINTWGQTGPGLLGKAIGKYGLVNYSVSSEDFLPIGCFEIEKLFSNEKLSDNSYSIHLFNAMWKVMKYPKYGYFDKNSILEVLKRRYGVKNSLFGFVRELLLDLATNDFDKGFRIVKNKIKYGSHLFDH